MTTRRIVGQSAGLSRRFVQTGAGLARRVGDTLRAEKLREEGFLVLDDLLSQEQVNVINEHLSGKLCYGPRRPGLSPFKDPNLAHESCIHAYDASLASRDPRPAGYQTVRSLHQQDLCTELELGESVASSSYQFAIGMYSVCAPEVPFRVNASAALPEGAEGTVTLN